MKKILKLLNMLRDGFVDTIQNQFAQFVLLNLRHALSALRSEAQVSTRQTRYVEPMLFEF